MAAYAAQFWSDTEKARDAFEEAYAPDVARERSWIRAWQAVRRGGVVLRIVDGVTYSVGATAERPYLVRDNVIYPWLW